MIVAIVGSRDLPEWAMKRAREEIRALLARPDVGTVVSGGARGIDSMGIAMAITAGKRTHEFYPDWQKHGKHAGFLRNERIVEAATEIHAWWDGKSPGTANTIGLAKRAGKVVVVHRMDAQ